MHVNMRVSKDWFLSSCRFCTDGRMPGRARRDAFPGGAWERGERGNAGQSPAGCIPRRSVGTRRAGKCRAEPGGMHSQAERGNEGNGEMPGRAWRDAFPGGAWERGERGNARQSLAGCIPGRSVGTRGAGKCRAEPGGMHSQAERGNEESGELPGRAWRDAFPGGAWERGAMPRSLK